MNDCPQCGRKLLSKASARCNWCGKEIEDPAYQAQAETAREAFFAHQAAHDAQSLANLRAVNADVYDPLGPSLPLVGGPLLDLTPRPMTTRRASDDRAVQRAVEQALAEQQAAPGQRTATGFPRRPVAPPAEPQPPTAPEPPGDVPEVRGDRFSHLEL